MTEPNGVRITTRDIYDRLVLVERKLDEFIAERRGENVPLRLRDHEDRIRRVERWTYAIPAALAMAIINALVLWLVK